MLYTRCRARITARSRSPDRERQRLAGSVVDGSWASGSESAYRPDARTCQMSMATGFRRELCQRARHGTETAALQLDRWAIWKDHPQR